MDTWRAFAESFVTLLVIMDPAGTAPVFVALTRRMTPRQRRWAAVRGVAAAGALIVGFAFFGGVLLGALGVSLGSLSIAGGLLLLLVALEMLRGIDTPDEEGDVALVPLATPLVAGPGAIATVIVLARRRPEVAVVGGALAALAVMVVALLLAERIARLVPAALLHFITRVLGLLLAAIAVQLVVDGVHALVTG